MANLDKLNSKASKKRKSAHLGLFKNLEGGGKSVDELVSQKMESKNSDKEIPKLPKIDGDQHEKIFQIEISKIKKYDKQVRVNFDDDKINELANSIKVNGVVNPLVLKVSGDSYEVISGERRLRASELAGLKTVPARVEKTERELLVSILDNGHREDLHPLEEAKNYLHAMEEFNLSTHAEVANKLGVSRQKVSEYLKMLERAGGDVDKIISTVEPTRKALRDYFNQKAGGSKVKNKTSKKVNFGTLTLTKNEFELNLSRTLSKDQRVSLKSFLLDYLNTL